MPCPLPTRAARPSPSSVVLPRVLAIAAAACLAAGCLGAPEPPPTAATPPPTSAPTPTPSPTASPSPSPTPSPTPYPTPVPTPTPVAAVSNGVWIPASQAERATRHPMAVMIDDAAAARPQSGLAYADVFYQALAEGGIPRYMAVFQASDPPTVGPVRSARRYFVGWAKEWRALYAHAGGAPNAMAAIAAANRKTLWDVHHGRYPKTLYRVSHRYSPHNVYSTAKLLRRLGKRLGATAPFTTPLWTFKEPAGMADRPRGGSIVIPYRFNRITYRYDRASNRYIRGVTGAPTQRDGTTRKVVAPTDVVVLFMTTGQLANDELSQTNVRAHRLDIDYIGTGKALVFRDGTVVRATWAKESDAAPTRLLYASGPLKGQPVPLVRGQIAIQVVPKGTEVTWKLGRPAPVPERAN